MYKFEKDRSIYGASMGRTNQLPENYLSTEKVRLEKMYLIDGDYDNGGAYWGFVMGSPLWVAYNDSTEIVVRASSREQAKALVQAHLPKARFYR